MIIKNVKDWSGWKEMSNKLRPSSLTTAWADINVACVEAWLEKTVKFQFQKIFAVSIVSIHGATMVFSYLIRSEKNLRMGTSLQYFTKYTQNSNNFFSLIIARDESWCHYFDPSSKVSSMQWEHANSPSPKKLKVQPSAGKVMLTFFSPCS